MPKDSRVLNITRGFRLRFNQACKAVENCACEWVEVGVSIRDLTLAESIAARAQQSKDREPLPYAEVFGLKYEGPAGSAAATCQSRVLAFEASLFFEDMAAQGISA